MANFKSDILDIATKGMNHHKQMMLDLITGYIKEHQTRYKVKGCSSYMTAIVTKYYQGNEEILSNNKEKAVSYANKKRKSIKIPNNGAEIIKLFLKMNGIPNIQLTSNGDYLLSQRMVGPY